MGARRNFRGGGGGSPKKTLNIEKKVAKRPLHGEKHITKSPIWRRSNKKAPHRAKKTIGGRRAPSLSPHREKHQTMTHMIPSISTGSC